MWLSDSLATDDSSLEAKLLSKAPEVVNDKVQILGLIEIIHLGDNQSVRYTYLRANINDSYII